MYLKDAPMHTLLVMKERMDEEMRLTYYVRREADVPQHLKNFVPIYRVACTQDYLWRSS